MPKQLDIQHIYSCMWCCKPVV